MKISTLTFLFWLWVTPALAALAVTGTPVVHDQETTADPVTFTYTTPAGTNLLVVGCHISNIAADITSATFDSVAMTEIGADTSGSSSYTKAFYLISPNIGSSLTVSVDMNGTEDGGCYAISFSGAHATTPITNVTTRAGTAATTTLSLDVTCATGNIAVDAGGFALVEATTMGGGQTSLMNGDDGSAQYLGSYEVSTGATVTMSWSWTTSASPSHVAWCVEAAAQARRAVGPIIFQ